MVSAQLRRILRNSAHAKTSLREKKESFTTMTIDVVIVSFNTAALLRRCLQSVFDTCSALPGARVVVVDNHSSDDSVELLHREFPQVHVIALNDNIGYGAAINRALDAHHSDAVLCLNPDTRLRPGAIEAMQQLLAEKPGAVAVGPRLVSPDGHFQPSCQRVPSLLRNLVHLSGLGARLSPRSILQTWLPESAHRSGARVDMISGACMLLRRDYLESIGGFDENLFLYEEEASLFIPAKRNDAHVYYCAEAVVEHAQGASETKNASEGTARYHRFRSKYYRFRKHHAPGAAVIAYCSDRLVFSVSLLINTLRGDASRARSDLALAQKAYRDSRKL